MKKIIESITKLVLQSKVKDDHIEYLKCRISELESNELNTSLNTYSRAIKMKNEEIQLLQQLLNSKN